MGSIRLRKDYETIREGIFQQTVRYDNIKNNYCLTNGINLLRIPYFDFDNIEDILTNHLIVS